MSFKGSKLKLERAKHHIADLVSVANKFCNSSPFDYEVLHNAKTHQRTLVAVVHEPIPKQIPLIIGDALHNLRSALDHLTWDVLRPFNPARDKVQFPFCRKAEGFESVLRNRQVHVAGEEIAQKFRELKPYPGGSDLLYG
ncbi:MAG: hypothetical protein QOD74_2184, partial [Variibacter sp.]|nr:hypothetical protein [Variibacter sp.]